MRKTLLVLVAAAVISNLIIAPCFAQDPLRKLGRGLVNIVTGIVEIPKKVILISKDESLPMGLTWGLVKGTAVGMLRIASGIYETATFPIPAPADYEPMIHPEFVFEEWE